MYLFCLVLESKNILEMSVHNPPVMIHDGYSADGDADRGGLDEGVGEAGLDDVGAAGERPAHLVGIRAGGQ
jgi:hypothetical protein